MFKVSNTMCIAQREGSNITASLVTRNNRVLAVWQMHFSTAALINISLMTNHKVLDVGNVIKGEKMG